MGSRYMVVKGSDSAHCCFAATVVDTTKPCMIANEPYVQDGVAKFEQMCECLEYEDAVKIAAALNACVDIASTGND